MTLTYIPYDDLVKDRLVDLNSYIQKTHAIEPGSILLNRRPLKLTPVQEPYATNKNISNVPNLNGIIYDFETKKNIPILYLGLTGVMPDFKSNINIPRLLTWNEIFIKFLYGDTIIHFRMATKCSGVDSFLIRKIFLARELQDEVCVQSLSDILERHRKNKKWPYNGRHVSCGNSEDIVIDQYIVDVFVQNNFMKC